MDAATVAPYVAAGVALVVGLVNPTVTNRLAARRQREQLDHDRAMRRRAEIISLLEDAANAGSKGLLVTDRKIDLWRDGIDPEDGRAQHVESERLAAVETLRDTWGRMEIRFPDDAAVRRQFGEWVERLDAYRIAVRKGYERGLDLGQQIQEIRVLRAAAAEAADVWLAMARAAVAELDDPGAATPVEDRRAEPS
jgi:hypothetical protein